MGKTTKQGLVWSIIFSNFKDHFTYIVFGREPCFSNIMLVVVVETSVAVFTTTAKKILCDNGNSSTVSFSKVREVSL